MRRIACWDVAAGLLIAAEAGAVVVPCRHPEDSCEPPAQVTVSLDRPAFVAAANQRVASGLHDLLTR